MSEIPTSNQEFVSEPELDRREIAVELRKLGIDVDFEDWDGMDDNDILGSIGMLALMHDFDIEDVLKTTSSVEEFAEESINVHEIVEILESFGVTTLDAATLAKLDVDAMQRMLVWHVKEVGLNLETIGQACFGESWQEGRWQ